MSAYNPLDGWIHSKPFTIEVAEEIGPILIDDGGIILDKDYDKKFTLTLESAGLKTCIAFDAGDESDIYLFGHIKSCLIRFPGVEPKSIGDFDTKAKKLTLRHIYK